MSLARGPNFQKQVVVEVIIFERALSTPRQPLGRRANEAFLAAEGVRAGRLTPGIPERVK